MGRKAKQSRKQLERRVLIILAVPPTVASTLAIVDRLPLPPLRGIAINVSVMITYGGLFLLSMAVAVVCMLLLWLLLRNSRGHVLTLVLVTFSAGMVSLGLCARVKPIVIMYPHDNAVVSSNILARGTARSTDTDVWIIVHPMATDGYWVQSRSAVGQDHSWVARACFGASDTFQVMAVVEPVEELRPGVVLANWPKAKARSQIVEVVRKAE